MQIKVKTLTGRLVPLNIEETDTIARVKERVQEKEGTLVRSSESGLHNDGFFFFSRLVTNTLRYPP